MSIKLGYNEYEKNAQYPNFEIHTLNAYFIPAVTKSTELLKIMKKSIEKHNILYPR